MKRLSVMIKPASALCNIRCKYCFYADVSSLREVKSHGKMKNDVMEKMIDNIFLDLEDGDEMFFAFQGGEPTIAGLSYFKAFVAYVEKMDKKVKVSYSIQTNGILITEDWCQFLKENRFLVGLSIDGNSELHNENRVDPRAKGTFERVIKTKSLFDTYRIDYNVLCVLTNQLARYPQKVFDFLIEEKIKFVQFIPCLDDLNAEKRTYYALEPKHFASFYNTLYKLWEKEYLNGNYISIGFFDSVITYLHEGRVTSCGLLGECRSQFIIESDGSVYPCDFYVLDEYRMGFITEQKLSELFKSPVLKDFLCTASVNNPAVFCQKCPFYSICRGGCKRMKHAVYLNEKETYCGYQDFLQKNIKPMEAIAQTLK